MSEKSKTIYITPITLKLYHKGEFFKSVDFKQESIIIGRVLSADLQIDDPKSSRLHAVIEVQDPQNVFVFDLGSSNGTSVNGELIKEHKLKSGDLIFIGSTTIMVHIGEEAIAIEAFEPPVPVSRYDDGVLKETFLIPTLVSDEEPKKRPRPVEEVLEKESHVLQPSIPSIVETDIHILKKEQKVLEVMMLWNDSIFNVRHFNVKEPVTLGLGNNNDFYFLSDKVPNSYNMIEYSHGECYFVFPAKSSGEMRMKKKMLTLDEIKNDSRTKTEKLDNIELFKTPLPADSKVILTIENITFFLQFTRPSNKYKKDYFRSIDKFFIVILAISIWAHFSFLKYAPIAGEKDDIETRFREPDRFTRLIIYSPEERSERFERVALDKEGAAKGEGQSKSKESESAKKGMDSAKKPGIRSKADDVGSLLSSITEKGQFKEIFKKGAFESKLEKALSSVGGRESKKGSSAVLGMRFGGKAGQADIGTISIPGVSEADIEKYGLDKGASKLKLKEKSLITIQEEETIIIGSLTKEEVESVVQSHIEMLSYCYEMQLMKNPSLEGKVEISWTIGPEGQVTKSFVKKSTLKNDDAENCMVRAIKRWRFPSPRGGGYVEVNYPFTFIKQ